MSQKQQYCRLAALGFFMALTAAEAADPERGSRLYENHCAGCHDSIVHIRENPKAQSAEDIRYQITRWADVLELPWTPAEVEDVLHYLNDTYYHYALTR